LESWLSRRNSRDWLLRLTLSLRGRKVADFLANARARFSRSSCAPCTKVGATPSQREVYTAKRKFGTASGEYERGVAHGHAECARGTYYTSLAAISSSTASSDFKSGFSSIKCVIKPPSIDPHEDDWKNGFALGLADCKHKFGRDIRGTSDRFQAGYSVGWASGDCKGGY